LSPRLVLAATANLGDCEIRPKSYSDLLYKGEGENRSRSLGRPGKAFLISAAAHRARGDDFPTAGGTPFWVGLPSWSGCPPTTTSRLLYRSRKSAKEENSS